MFSKQIVFMAGKVRLPQLDLPCVVAAEPAAAWHGVVLFADTKAMEMKVRPIKADLQDRVKIGQGAIGSYDKAPPEHRGNPANPNVDKISFGLRIVFHDAGQPISWTTPRPFLPPGLKCSRF